MEKMNQVSVSEFFAKSKEEMYDMAVEMVEKYNRLIDRHAVYTNALNNDIADKAAKIELLEKEIEGRKEGYYALKELMDTKYISIEEHNKICKTYENKVAELKKESEKWQDLAKMNRDTIVNQYDVCEEFKMKIAELEEENEKLKVDLIHEREKNEKLAKDHAELENDIRKYTTEIISQSGTICNLKKELDARGEEIKKLEEKVKHQRENLDGINKTLDIKIKENERLIAVRNNKDKEIEAHESENARLTEKIMELKKERDKHMSRVNDLRMELDCMKARKEKHEEAAHDKVVEGLRETITYWRNKYVAAQEEIEKLDGTIEEWKNKERIRTNELRATERKVEELWEEIERLRDLGEHWKRSYFNIRYSLNKLKEDDHGRKGFKLYVKSALIEAKGDKNEANEIITEAVRSAYAEWDKTQKENEKTIKKAIKEVMNKKYGYAGEIAFRIRSEVDKKRIVDIGEGAEKILGVSRELFDAAIKALVDDGYQEIIGRIPQATNSYVYMDMHVLATPDVETRETANAENIKSLDFNIPCGEDAIE